MIICIHLVHDCILYIDRISEAKHSCFIILVSSCLSSMHVDQVLTPTFTQPSFQWPPLALRKCFIEQLGHSIPIYDARCCHERISWICISVGQVCDRNMLWIDNFQDVSYSHRLSNYIKDDHSRSLILHKLLK